MNILVKGLLGLSFIVSAQAEWGLMGQVFRLRYQERPFKNPYTATLWGGVQSYSRFTHEGQSEVFRVLNPDFESSRDTENGGLPTSITLQRDRSGQPLKRPLVFFTPGFASGHLTHWAVSAIVRYYHLGYHVVTLPNPVSVAWVSQKYRGAPGDALQESKTLHSVMNEVRRHIGDEHISVIYLAGESHGSFMTSLVAALDTEMVAPAEKLLSDNSKIMLESPPHIFLETLNRLDNAIDASKAIYDKRCYGIMAKVRVIASQLLHDEASEQGEIVNECSEAIVLHDGFKEKLFEVAEAYAEAHNLDFIPQDKKARAQWRMNLRMVPFFRDHSPASYALLQDPKLNNLGYWLSIVRSNSNVQIYVAGAVDDFLNDPTLWKSNPYFKFDDSNLLLYPWGGHMGFQITQAYEDLLKVTF